MKLPNLRSASVLVVLLLLADTSTRAGSDSAATDNLARGVATFEALRATGRNQPARTIERLALPNAREQFNKLTKDLWINVVPEEGWSNFFASSVYSMTFLPSDCVVTFYHPWADVALVTLWEKQQTGLWRISDMEMLLGDFIRRKGESPYDPTPAWTSDKRIPALAVADITQTTFNALATTFASASTRITTPREWRSAWLNGRDENVIAANRLGASHALEQNIRGLLELLRDKRVSGEIDDAFAKLTQGKLDDVLKGASATPKETAALLRQFMPEHWGDLHLASYAGGKDTRFVLFESNPPDSFICFTLSTSNQAAPNVTRLDFINHRVYREFLSANK